MYDTAKRNELTQEFIVRVVVTTVDSDPKVLRALLDKAEKNLEIFKYTDSSGTVETILVHPN